MDRVRALRAAMAVMPVVSLVLVLGLVFTACGSSGGAIETTAVGGTDSVGDTVTASGGRAAPPFSGLTLDGDNVSLDQFRGKPLLLVYMTYS